MSESKSKQSAPPRPLHLHVAIPEGYELRIDGYRIRIGPIEDVAIVGSGLFVGDAEELQRQIREGRLHVEQTRRELLPCGCRGLCVGHESSASGAG